MNEQSHWDKIAPGYNEEIFDVFASDKEKKLERLFSKHGNRNHMAIDFGCGTGKALPFVCLGSFSGLYTLSFHIIREERPTTVLTTMLIFMVPCLDWCFAPCFILLLFPTLYNK